MTKNLDKDGFCSIVDNYQLFYIDLWGVIHNGINLHKEAINVLKEITKKGKEYILLTNAPRPNDVVIPKTVVSIAMTSIKIARGLLADTFSPSSELTLKGNLLLYEANAKHKPREE